MSESSHDRGAQRTVRDAVLDVMRAREMTTIFGNPGSTEIPFLTDLPGDFEFVLALHEGSLVGIASGHAIGSGRPAFVNLHTAPGLGNAVNAIAGARDNRAPLVIVVGQQDRRQLALAPFLTGRSLEKLAGEYPVWTETPARAQDLPGAIARAWHEADQARGPALVIAPMGDWDEPADEHAAGSPSRVLRAPAVSEQAIAELAALVERASSPALVVGAGIDTRAGWDGAVALAERLNAPVWGQEFGSRAGFPQDHRLFAGHLHWSRRRMRESLAGNDLVIAIGSAAFLLYIYDPGAMVAPEASVVVISEEPEEINRSTAELALLAPPAIACAMLAERLAQREGPDPAPRRRAPDPPAPAPGEPLLPGHVFLALRERLAENVVLMEESPSSRPELMERIPARQPMGFISGANGALGFGISAATGLAMALRGERPVVAVLGDGASLYSIQALWSAARYGAPLLAIVMANHRYAVMDGLAERAGGRGAWPGFDSVEIAVLAEGLGCPARRIAEHSELLAALDELLPGLERRDGPMLLRVELAAGA